MSRSVDEPIQNGVQEKSRQDASNIIHLTRLNGHIVRKAVEHQGNSGPGQGYNVGS